MLKGIENVDASSCAALRPDTQGYNGRSYYEVVRNPNWNPRIDPYAKDYPNEIVWTIQSSTTRIYDGIASGQFDLAVGTSMPEAVYKRYSSSPTLRRLIHSNDGDDTWYLSMNLTQAPFDDLDVRRAMNWVMNKAALVNAWGGAGIGAIAGQIVPEGLFDDQLARYDPYETAGNDGSLAKAKAAMAGSRYDTRHNGMCDASVCKHVPLVWDGSMPAAMSLLSVVETDAAEIGITFSPRPVDDAYRALGTPSDDIAFSDGPGWAKDYADPLTFLQPLFDGRTIAASGTSDYSLVGITPAQCARLHVKGDCTAVPSVDGQLDRCAVLAGQPRLSCYERLDQYLMTEVVPWVPYLDVTHTFLTSAKVTHYAYDQFTDMPAYENISLAPSRQPPGSSKPFVA
jgi:ABC-type transport system substrate-binding protein